MNANFASATRHASTCVGPNRLPLIPAGVGPYRCGSPSDRAMSAAVSKCAHARAGSEAIGASNPDRRCKQP